jgi:hypothetical protein
MRRRHIVVIISVAVVGIAFSLWIQRSGNPKRHYSPPFIELKCYASHEAKEPFYTLYIADAKDSEDILAADGGLSVRRSDQVVEVFGQGALQYHKTTISCGPSGLSIDGKELPPTPSQAVIKRDGQVVVGAFLRNYD